MDDRSTGQITFTDVIELVMNHETRFRAYDLQDKGSSMSLSVDNYFVLIEARYNDDNMKAIDYEVQKAGVDRINLLHITSWDEDHCNPNELEVLLDKYKPLEIEYPGYEPHKDCGNESRRHIWRYSREHPDTTVRHITPKVVNACTKVPLKGQDIYYNPIEIKTEEEKVNDNSIVRFFRIGTFQILSTGDCMDEAIADRLAADEILKSEVDVLILAHHGSKNSITTTTLLDNLSPRFAICTVDRQNVYNHPDEVIRQRLRDRKIPYLTTKDGDVLLLKLNAKHYRVWQKRSTGWKEHEDSPFSTKTWYLSDL